MGYRFLSLPGQRFAVRSGARCWHLCLHRSFDPPVSGGSTDTYIVKLFTNEYKRFIGLLRICNGAFFPRGYWFFPYMLPACARDIACGIHPPPLKYATPEHLKGHSESRNASPYCGTTLRPRHLAANDNTIDLPLFSRMMQLANGQSNLFSRCPRCSHARSPW